MRNSITALLISALFAAFLAGPVLADGFIVVHPPRPGITPTPLAVKYHHVDVEIQDQIATTTVDQVFVNPNNMQLEGTYIFPLPEGAVVSDMSMWIDGREMKAELLPRDEAVKIYTDIVRKMKDPAILEYMGNRMFRMRIFPIEARGQKRIKIQYSEKIGIDAGLMTYRYPLSTEKFSSRPLEEVVVNVAVKSTVPLKALFSPSHEVETIRKDDHNARVGYEEKNVTPDRDFILYCSFSEKRFGAALVASKEKTQDGYYALFIAPGHEVAGAEVQAKDVVFVVDTSGSMKEPARKPWKIDQAKGALKFCINSLHPKDRFNIVSFATGARTFRKKLQAVNDDTRSEAVEFVKALEAAGGTNIHEALQATLAMQDRESSRPFVVVFLTDGQPTAGDIQQAPDLVSFARKNAGPHTRLFVFGVGYDVNTHLLDKLALENKGDRMYVSPEENIEVKVSGFYDKIAYPVLSDLKVAVNGVETYDVYPPRIPDLFRGSQVVIYGRYAGSGHAAVRLTGTCNGKARELVYEVVFPERSRAHENIPRLWATTKIGYLLDQLRLKGIDVASGRKPTGPEKELVDEIVALATEFGILTPYTALLVIEESRELAAGPAAPAALRILEAKKEGDMDEELEKAGDGYTAVAGEAAVKLSRRAREMQTGATNFLSGRGRHDDFGRALNTAGTFKSLGTKTFVLVNGVWYDSLYRKGMETIKVTFLSDDYIDLVTRHPLLARYLSIGEQVVVCLDGKVYQITS